MTLQTLSSAPRILAALALVMMSLALRGQTCVDTIQYVMHKNLGGTAGYVLVTGTEEQAAQAYHLTSPATLRGIRVFGQRLTGQLEMRALVHATVPGSNLPSSPIDSSAWSAWGAADQSRGYKDFAFSRALNDSFACAIQMRTVSGLPQFQITYNGDGEGRSENLASVRGTATAMAWQSILPAPRSRNGDLYLLPILEFPVQALFTHSGLCLDVAESLALTSAGVASICTDSMMNTSLLAGYAGGFTPHQWVAPSASFVSGTASSANPTVQYASAGCNALSLIVTHDGWTSLCADTLQVTASVGLAATLLSADSTTCHISNAGYSPNGELHLQGTGGCPSYGFSLSLGGTPIGSVPASLTADFLALAPGTYQLILADASPMMPGGCRDTSTFTVHQPTPITIDSTDATLATCGVPNGTLTLHASGGSGTLQYAVDAGAPVASNSFTALAGGMHLFTVSDAYGCSTDDSIAVPQNPGAILSLVSATPATCPLGSDGQIQLSATGGLGTLQYHLSTTPPQASPLFPGLSAGTFTAYVVDSSSCVDSITGIVVGQPPLFSRTVIATHISCHGLTDGAISLTATAGGTGPQTYSLDGTAFISSPAWGGLAPGPHTIVTRDSIGCSDTLLVTLNEPTLLVIDSLDIRHLSCNGSGDGSIQVFPAGGSPGYQYRINFSVFGGISLFAALNAGTYTMTVRDANGCLTDTVVTLTQPPVITASITPTATTCGSSVGSIFATASGGSGGGYTFSLDSVSFVSPGIFTGLAAGAYHVWVRDGSGCIKKFPTLVLNTGGPAITSHSSTNITCNGSADGTITVGGVTGGSGVLQYSVNGGAYSPSPAFSGLPAGLHDVVVRDGLGCTDTLEVELFEPAAILILPTLYHVGCAAGSDGAVSIFAAGGVGGFQYSLDGAVYQPVPFFTGLTAGPYTVHVRDGGGCVATLPITLTEAPALLLSGTWTDVTCFGDNDGTITLASAGGSGAHEYSLDGITWQDSALFTGLDGGPYFVQVRDSNLCVTTLPLVVGEPSALAFGASITNASDCATATDGAIDILVVGGTPPYTIVWNTPGGFLSTEEDIDSLPVGFYFADVTDSLGCNTRDTFEVTCLSAMPSFSRGEVRLHPNPAQDLLQITCTWPGDFHWQVIDLRGVVVLHGNAHLRERLHVGDLPKGAYAVRVSGEWGSVVKRVVVQ